MLLLLLMMMMMMMFVTTVKLMLRLLDVHVTIPWDRPREDQGKRVNPHIDRTPQFIPLKLFLDVVPRSSVNVSRVMRGQPKPLSQRYLRRNGGKVLFYVCFVLVWHFIPLWFIRFSFGFLVDVVLGVAAVIA